MCKSCHAKKSKCSKKCKDRCFSCYNSCNPCKPCNPCDPCRPCLVTGPTGPSGNTGSTGPTGNIGNTGPTGSTVPAQGFSAFRSETGTAQALVATTPIDLQFTNITPSPPYFNVASVYDGTDTFTAGSTGYYILTFRGTFNLFAGSNIVITYAGSGSVTPNGYTYTLSNSGGAPVDSNTEFSTILLLDTNDTITISATSSSSSNTFLHGGFAMFLLNTA